MRAKSHKNVVYFFIFQVKFSELSRSYVQFTVNNTRRIITRNVFIKKAPNKISLGASLNHAING